MQKLLRSVQGEAGSDDTPLGQAQALMHRAFAELDPERRRLLLTWSGRPSRFLAELGVARRAEPRKLADEDLPPAFAALRTWRLERAKADEVPAYVVFHNSTLAEIADRQPRTLAELARVPGVGPTKLERYGDDVLASLASCT